MASRLKVSSTTGLIYTHEPSNVSAVDQSDIYTNLVALGGLSALLGKTIRGLVVNSIERWADGGVWDATNNRHLFPGSDFDVSLLQR